MRTNLVRIGNSHGVRLPKALIAAARLGPEIDLELVDGTLVLRAAPEAVHPRAGWEQAFQADPGPLTRDERDWIDADLSSVSEKDWTW
jgi:antitoxin MazE